MEMVSFHEQISFLFVFYFIGGKAPDFLKGFFVFGLVFSLGWFVVLEWDSHEEVAGEGGDE